MPKPNKTTALITAIDAVMAGGGFLTLDGPLVISGIPFDVLRAYTSGPGFLDLVVVIDATDGSESQLRRGYWLIERIASALDQAKSSRSLTAVVLHDAAAARVPTEDFLRHGRVLLVTDPATVAVELAPILPIVLDSSAEDARDPLETLLSGIGAGRDARMKRTLAQVARNGPEKVQAEFVGWIDHAFNGSGTVND